MVLDSGREHEPPRRRGPSPSHSGHALPDRLADPAGDHLLKAKSCWNAWRHALHEQRWNCGIYGFSLPPSAATAGWFSGPPTTTSMLPQLGHGTSRLFMTRSSLQIEISDSQEPERNVPAHVRAVKLDREHLPPAATNATVETGRRNCPTGQILIGGFVLPPEICPAGRRRYRARRGDVIESAAADRSQPRAWGMEEYKGTGPEILY